MKLIQALPSLKFLDDNKIASKERPTSSEMAHAVTNLKYQGTNYKLTRTKHKDNSEFHSISKCNKSVEESFRFYKRKPGSVYGKLKYKYLGKNSEGNRFINSFDL